MPKPEFQVLKYVDPETQSALKNSLFYCLKSSLSQP